jgi:hypothetical protein
VKPFSQSVLFLVAMVVLFTIMPGIGIADSSSTNLISEVPIVVPDAAISLPWWKWAILALSSLLGFLKAVFGTSDG